MNLVFQDRKAVKHRKAITEPSVSSTDKVAVA